MWNVNEEQYKRLVQEVAWGGIRVTKETVYFLDGAGIVREGTVDVQKLTDETEVYKANKTNIIPVVTKSGKVISIKWVMILGSDTRTCRSFALGEYKRTCEKLGIEGFNFKSLAWNKAIHFLRDGMSLRELINIVNEYIEKVEIIANDIPRVKSSLSIIECVRKDGNRGQPVLISLSLKLNRCYKKDELKPYIRKLNTEMMQKLVRHWKFKGFEHTMYQYQITRVYLNEKYELEYDVRLRDEYNI